MPPFRFRLERVLSVRRHEEERDRMIFAAAMQKVTAAEGALADIQEKMRLAQEHAASIVFGKPTIEDLVRSHDYRVALIRREAEASAAVVSAKEIFEEARKRLIAARKKRRVLERLRERRHVEWRRDEEAREQTDIDEIGLATFVRSREATL